MPEKTPVRYVLTTDCPDTTGVVAAIAGFLAKHNALITEAQHFDDEISVRSFMRTVFHDNGKGMPSIAELERDFAESVAAQIADGNRSIVGLMLESNLEAGNQPIPADRSQLRYGVSVTDPCIDWTTTEHLLRSLDERLRRAQRFTGHGAEGNGQREG